MIKGLSLLSIYFSMQILVLTLFALSCLPVPDICTRMGNHFITHELLTYLVVGEAYSSLGKELWIVTSLFGSVNTGKYMIFLGEWKLYL